MSTPPRRRRTEPRRSASGSGGGWLPTIALGLGVIVAGLGIGALVAVLMQRTTPKDQVVAAVTSAPSTLPATTRPPIAIATLEPPRSQRPSSSSSPSPSREPSPLAASPSPAPSQATSAPTVRAAPAATVVARATPAAPATSVTSAAPVASATPIGDGTPLTQPAPAVQTTTQSAAVTPAPIASREPAALPSVAASGGAASTYEQHASGVVRGYIDALIRGDQKTAYHALGEDAGGAPGALTERSFIDPSARIVSLKVTRIDASNASVGCEIASAKGHYYATYHVSAGSSGPYISEHDYIKVST